MQAKESVQSDALTMNRSLLSLVLLGLNRDTPDYRDIIESILNTLTHRQQVQYAVYCISDLDKYYDTVKYENVKKTRDKVLELLDSWLIDSNSVTSKQLDDAAHAAAAAYAASATASAAAHAAAYAAAYAAAHAAAYAKDFDSTYHSEIKKHLLYLLNMVDCKSEVLMMVME